MSKAFGLELDLRTQPTFTQYREHINTLAAQKTTLDKQLLQWEKAVSHGNHNTPNDVHITGDMNIDNLKGRWLQFDYALVTLARKVIDCFNTFNFTQVVDKITRVQFNSIRNKTATSCIDHVYCNAKHRISPGNILSFEASDHDAILYTRYSKKPAPPAKEVQ